MRHILASLGMLSCGLAACSDLGGGAVNAQEVITTVILELTPAGGPPIVAEFDDPDGDGGLAPTIDRVNLTADTYTFTVRFQNRLVTPAEEITEEVSDESDVHQLFFTGTAVVGPASSTTTGPLMHSYTDMDRNGLPVGLASSIIAMPGTGTLTVTLRHMPPEEPPGKDANSAAQVRTGGFDAIGGSTDVQVNFPVEVL